MNKVAIVTDSTCDLNKDFIEENEIKVMPLYVNFGDVSYKDGVEINVPELYKKVEELKELPKTSAASVGDFMNVFNELLEQGYDIIYTGISASMSSTFQNARLAAEDELDKRIFVVDSKNLSTGIGLILMKMVKFRNEGLSAKEIYDRILEIVPKVRSQFAIERMEYLYKGGRCSALTALFGTILNIKPIIVVREGKMSVGKKPMGKMKRALDAMLDMLDKDKDNVDLDCIMITHSEANKSALYLQEELEKRYDKSIINQTNAGCVISSHCGAGTIGILYVLKN